MSYRSLLANSLGGAAPIAAISYGVVVAMAHALLNRERAYAAELHSARATAEPGEARHAALRMQMDPHFLNNTINGVLVLLRDGDSERAGRMLDLLGAMLRHPLRTLVQRVRLGEEIEFMEAMLRLEQIRFGERLVFGINVARELRDEEVLPFLLQPLVENAIRHAVGRSERPVRIDASAWRCDGNLILEVTDDGPGIRDAERSSGGIGLANTRARLSAVYGDRADLVITGGVGTGVRVRLVLPQSVDAARPASWIEDRRGAVPVHA